MNANTDNLVGPEGIVKDMGEWIIFKVKVDFGYEFEARNVKHNIFRGPFFSAEEAENNAHF